jgi:hypothetical protein
MLWHHQGVSEPQKDGVEVPVVWGDPADLTIHAVNQFAAQFLDHATLDELVLTAGSLVPPILTGDEESRRAALANLERVEIRPVVRIAMNRARLRELTELLRRILDRAESSGGGEDVDSVESS